MRAKATKERLLQLLLSARVSDRTKAHTAVVLASLGGKLVTPNHVKEVARIAAGSTSSSSASSSCGSSASSSRGSGGSSSSTPAVQAAAVKALHALSKRDVNIAALVKAPGCLPTLIKVRRLVLQDAGDCLTLNCPACLHISTCRIVLCQPSTATPQRNHKLLLSLPPMPRVSAAGSNAQHSECEG